MNRAPLRWGLPGVSFQPLLVPIGTICVDCRGLSPLGSSAFLWIYIPLGFIARSDGLVRTHMVSSGQIPLVYVTDPVLPDY